MRPVGVALPFLIMPALALAQDLDDQSNVNLVFTEASYSSCGDPIFELLEEQTCRDFPGDRVPGEAFIWFILGRLGGFPEGVGGAQFGVIHTLDDPVWSLCTGGLSIPQEGWPESDTGTAVTWAGGCYEPAGESARIGYLYVADGEDGDAFVVGDPRLGDIAIYADCEYETRAICPVGLGSTLRAECGCETLPVRASSWGAIKAAYRAP